MKVFPLPVKEANKVVKLWHRHSAPVGISRWALGAEHDGKTAGVIICGNPIAGVLHDGLTIEALRLCAVPGAPKNTCSFLYAAARRVWQSMGGSKIVTYTLPKEGGASLRAAGFVHVATTKPAPKGWGRKGRRRKTKPIYAEIKHRWESPTVPQG